MSLSQLADLDHDIARTYQDYFHGDFNLDDIALGEEGLNRLGNVIVPNECYGEILERLYYLAR